MQVKFKWTTAFLILLCGIIGILVYIKSKPVPLSGETNEKSAAKTPEQNPMSTPVSEDPYDFKASYMEMYGTEETTPEDDVKLVSSMLESAFLVMKDQMPSFSGNQDLVTILQGKNPSRMKFLSSPFPYLDQEGQLLDRWRRPLFFHRISGSLIDVRSAGPDGIMWNADDLHTGRQLENPDLRSE